MITEPKGMPSTRWRALWLSSKIAYKRTHIFRDRESWTLLDRLPLIAIVPSHAKRNSS